jgi:hypothetical protein
MSIGSETLTSKQNDDLRIHSTVTPAQAGVQLWTVLY